MKFEPKYSITLPFAKKLVETERHNEAIKLMSIAQAEVNALCKSSREESTHFSTKIDGNSLNLYEVEQTLNNENLVISGKEKDQVDVRTYFSALKFIDAEHEKGTVISEDFIRQLHGFVVSGLDQPSAFRIGQSKISDYATGRIIYMPPEAKDVNEMMQALISWLNSEIKREEIPVPILAGIVHYQFCTIHPFDSANGRTVRLLTAYLLRKMDYGIHGIYSLEEYYAQDANLYYGALTIGPSNYYYMGREGSEITPFLAYFIGGMANSYFKVRNHLENSKGGASVNGRTARVQKPSVRLERDPRELKAKQRQSLSLFAMQKEVASTELAEHLGIPVRSAHALMKKWTDQKFVQIVDPSRKARTYSLTDEWEALIEEERRNSLFAK